MARAALDTDGDGTISAQELAAATGVSASVEPLTVCTLSDDEIEAIGTKESPIYKIADIKKALQEYGLDVSGSKAEKVQRLKNHCHSLKESEPSDGEGKSDSEDELDEDDE